MKSSHHQHPLGLIHWKFRPLPIKINFLLTGNVTAQEKELLDAMLFAFPNIKAAAHFDASQLLTNKNCLYILFESEKARRTIHRTQDHIAWIAIPHPRELLLNPLNKKEMVEDLCFIEKVVLDSLLLL